MNSKKTSRIRRARATRLHLRKIGAVRLTVNRTPRHIYAQIVSPAGDKILVAASTVEESLREQATGNTTAAQAVGKLIAERALAAGIKTVAFDRAGFQYHGRVKALADAAREAGLEF